MAKVLLFGFGPLSSENLRMSGPSLRTWNFLSVLLNHQHEVCLIGNRGHGVYPEDLPPMTVQKKDALTYVSVSNETWAIGLAPIVAEYRAGCDCVVAASTPASAIAAEHAGDLPLWCDLYGHIMAEAQMKAHLFDDDSYLNHFWNIEQSAINRGDKFSCVSQRQQWACVGELGALGRLNKYTVGYEFATTIPASSETKPYQMSHKVLRGTVANDDDFVILYSGGYNTWTDIDTLFAALEYPMSQHPKVVFVSTGGNITGHNDLTYTRFTHMIESSPYRDRFRLQGWVPSADVPGYYLESNLAVNSDKISLEAEMGSRTRVLDWLRAELPCVLTDLPELGASVVQAHAGLAYKPYDSDDLSRCLLYCANHPDETAQMGRNGRQLLLDAFTFEATAGPLLQWVEQPKHAPDYDQARPSFATVSPGTPLSQVERVAAVEKRSLPVRVALRSWKIAKPIMNIAPLRPLKARISKFGRNVIGVDSQHYGLSYLSITLPKVMFPHQSVQGEIVVKNTGKVIWLPARDSANGVNVSYSWYAFDGTIVEREGVRTE